MGYTTHTFAFYGTFIQRHTETANLFEPFVEHGGPTVAAPGIEVDVIGCAVLGVEQISICFVGTTITTKSEQPPKKIGRSPDAALLIAFLASRGVDAASLPEIGWYLAARTL